MRITILTKVFAIDSIEYTGNMLEAFVYDPADNEHSVAVPIMTRQDIEAYMTTQGRQVEELEDFLAVDYFTTFKEQIALAILVKYPELKAKAKRHVCFFFTLIGLIHLGPMLIGFYYSVWLALTIYIVGMLFSNKYAHNKQLIK